MVKEKLDLLKTQALEEENKILRQKIADLEVNQHSMVNALGDGIANEMKKIRQKGRASANTITVTEKHDHKNISLWTKYGKRIGPMHPDNAIQTLNRFADIGIILSSDQPTNEQIQAWSNSAEGKAFHKKELARREERLKSKKSGQMEKLANEIAKMSGTTVEAINHILKASEVGKK